MPQYAALIYDIDVDWTEPQYSDVDVRLRRLRRTGVRPRSR